MKFWLLFLLLPTVAIAIAPLHPDAPSYDGLHNIDVDDYTSTRLIHPSICKGLSSQGCDTWEDEMQNNARLLRDLMLTTNFLKPLVLLIRFTDHVNRVLPAREDYIKLFNGVGISDTTPTGSISEWVALNSYNQIKIEAEVVDWIMTNNTELHFALDSFGVPVSGLTQDFRFAMYPVLDQLYANNFDFSAVDHNNDGLIDNIIIVHSGYPAEIGGNDCETGATGTERIWAHTVAFQTDQWTAPDGSIQANGYSVSSGLRGLCDGGLARIGVTTHELMHTFGLPDLHDMSSEGIGKGLGYWDIMSNPYGRNGDGTSPGHLSAWSKWILGWIEPIQIVKDGIYDITASEKASEYYRIDWMYPTGEYLLIENRQPSSYDSLLGMGGILIYHIDDNVQTGQSTRGYPGQSGWPGNGKHYQVALLQGDRKFDLEKGENSGDDGDFWNDGMLLGPGPLSTVGTNNSLYFPNTNSYQSGNIQQTELKVYDFSASNTTMTFRVSGIPVSQLATSSASVTAPSPITSPVAPSTTPSPISSWMPSISLSRNDPVSAQPLVTITPQKKSRQADKVSLRLSGGGGGAGGSTGINIFGGRE